jgi:prophage antirepressor-like protein
MTMQTILFNSKPIRMIYEDGVRWFALCDVCEAIGLTNQTTVLRLIPIDEVRRLHELTTDKIATKREQKMIMVGIYGLDHFLKVSHKPLARDMRAWLTSMRHIDRRPNQKEQFQEFVNVYVHTDRTYGLRMAAKILRLNQDTFPPWIAENFLEPDGHTPKEKYAHLFHVKIIIDDKRWVHHQVFLTDDAYTFFNRPANRMTLPAPEVIPWDPKFPDELSD